MRRALLATVVVLLAGAIPPLFAASPALANPPDRASGSLTVAGCAVTDAVSWGHLPPIYEIDTTLNQNGFPFIVAGSVISYPQLGQPRLSSPQVIETFGMESVVLTSDYSVTFVLKDRNGRVVTTTTSPVVALACALT